jgi:hypothetical protein
LPTSSFIFVFNAKNAILILGKNSALKKHDQRRSNGQNNKNGQRKPAGTGFFNFRALIAHDILIDAFDLIRRTYPSALRQS